MLAEVRRLANAPAVLRRMRVVNTPVRFATNQSRRAPGIHNYGIRGSGLRIALRHGTNDLAAFNEVFVNGDYRPPRSFSSIFRDYPAPRVLDLGANIGSYALWVLARNRKSRVLSVEPDPENATVIRFAQHLNHDVDWKLVEAAATTENGRAQFAAGRGTGSRIAYPHDDNAITVPTVDALPLLDDCDVAKMDVEGGEWPILADPRLADCRVRLLAVEYHARDGLDGVAATDMLRNAGFETHGPVAKSSTMGLVWAYRW